MYILILVLALGWGVEAAAAGYGFDVVTPPAVYATELAQSGVMGQSGTWMRVRGVVDAQAVKAGAERTVEGDRAGLRALRARGVKTMVILRWDRSSWAGGARAGWGHRLPLDLREAFERGRWLGATYGDLVDGWEIDNEPDIDFGPDNPETYAAFLKAMYLGLHEGAKSLELGAESLELGAIRGELGAGSSNWLARKRGGVGFEVLSSQLPAHSSKLRAPLVVMAAPALPPGPYFERLCVNGILSYTDGFNFHYYGYAEDFSGVYRQFEAAVAELGARSLELGARSSKLQAHSYSRRALPVFITEYGFGLLDAQARNTVEGRVRQWQWFASVVKQVHALRPEGPMAFLVNPYFEAGMNEFGLSMVQRPGFEAAAGVSRASAGVGDGVVFRAGDFGAREAAPWMGRIGQKLGEHFASPALAYLWDYAERNPYRSRPWEVHAPAPAPVVVDFIPEADMKQWKSGGGYLLGGAERLTGAGKQLGGGGRVVLYNFGREQIAGHWRIEGGRAGDAGERPQAVVLAAGERREVPVEFKVQAGRFVGEVRRVVFTPAKPGAARAEWVTRLFPDTAGMVATPVGGFDFSEGSNRVRAAALLRRPLAVGEPALQAQGRWLVTPGVRVEEGGGGLWRFHVDYLPAEALRPAMVELPLPEGFKIEPETMLVLERRKVAVAGGAVAGGAGVAEGQRQPRVGKLGAMMDVYFRTENGNLYQTWPRLRVEGEWASYAENLENFTMGFFGRAVLPWRLRENRPVALVFFLRAGEVPTVFEVKGARIVRLGGAEPATAGGATKHTK